MIDWNYLIKIGIALFAIVNVVGSVPVFVSATEGWPESERKRVARTVALTVFMVLTLSVFVGDKMLSFFGISVASFQVGGGILLLLIAISMMHARQSGARQTEEEAIATADHAVTAIVPLSIPLLAGPGAISSLIIAAEHSGGLWGHVCLIAPVAVVCFMVWWVLLLANTIANHLGTIGINIVTRLMGLILAAMAIEFMARGLGSLFPGLLS